MEKQCKACGETKLLTEFGTSKITKDGREGKCRECRKAARLNSSNDIECQNCGKLFKSIKGKAKFCGSVCQGFSKRRRVEVTCSSCGKEISVPEHKFNNHENLYCDQDCRTKHLSTLMVGERNPNYLRVDFSCSGCGVPMKVQPHKVVGIKKVFCSNSCYRNNIGKYSVGRLNSNYRERLQLSCHQCGNAFKRKLGVFNRNAAGNHFCSRGCYMNYLSEISGGRRVDRKIFKCPICSHTFEKLDSQAVGKKRLYCSVLCRNKGTSLFMSGPNHPNWNPYLSDLERSAIRATSGYQAWRVAVYKRDHFSCRVCADSSGGNLNAHHLNGYHWCVEGRQDVDNGVTLCKRCHSEFHEIFGYTFNTVEQFEEYVLSKDA